MRPVISFTNGVDVFLWDDAQGYPFRKVYGFYSKDSLEYLAHQRTNKKALATVEPNLAIANRMYQLEAVKRSKSTRPAFVAAFVAQNHRGNALNSIAAC